MPDPLLALLDVQDRDLAADRLRHRRASLPERATLSAQQGAVTALDTELAGLDEQLGELARSQRRLEDEVSALESKRAAENTKLYSGSVTSPRELQAMQEEIDALARRQRELEDSLIEIMERVEPISAEAESRRAERTRLVEENLRLGEVIAAAEAVIDAELAGVVSARAGFAEGVPPDLLASYEKLRAHLGGVGVARLEGTQCSGCHLTLPATELDAVRRAVPGDVVYHEECGRILVR